MPQLNTSIYFHEYGWLVTSFFFFYLIFLKYHLSSLIHWMKFKSKSLAYYLNHLGKIDNIIKSVSRMNLISYVYRIMLNSSLLTQLDHALSKSNKSIAFLSNFSIERTVFNFLIIHNR